MPCKGKKHSSRQIRYMFVHEPKVAKKWAELNERRKKK